MILRWLKHKEALLFVEAATIGDIIEELAGRLVLAKRVKPS